MQQKNNNFIVCTMVFPRYEWPFIYDWILHYNKLGVNNFLIGIDRTNNHSLFKGTEKLKHKYYHLDKSDNEIYDLFFNEILKVKKINNNINIFTIDIFYSDIQDILQYPNSNLNILRTNDHKFSQINQTVLHKFCLNYSVKNNIDYIINIDVDEYIEIDNRFKNINQLFNYFEKRYPKIKSFYIKEYVCSGRFDENGDYRKVKDIKTQNKVLTDLVKWITKPDESLIKPERIVYTIHKDLNTKKYITLNDKLIWYNHYRGYKNWTLKDYYDKYNLNKVDL